MQRTLFGLALLVIWVGSVTAQQWDPNWSEEQKQDVFGHVYAGMEASVEVVESTIYQASSETAFVPLVLMLSMDSDAYLDEFRGFAIRFLDEYFSQNGNPDGSLAKAISEALTVFWSEGERGERLRTLAAAAFVETPLEYIAIGVLEGRTRDGFMFSVDTHLGYDRTRDDVEPVLQDRSRRIRRRFLRYFRSHTSQELELGPRGTPQQIKQDLLGILNELVGCNAILDIVFRSYEILEM
jgi:flagellar basal body-associated protein FliL